MKRVYVYIAALLALVLTTACEEDKWGTEQPESVEVLELYNMKSVGSDEIDVDSKIDLYTQNRDGKLPLMIVDSPAGIESYEMLNYSEKIEGSKTTITFYVESVDLAPNELQFVADYKIVVDYLYGYATIWVDKTDPNAAASIQDEIQASYQTIHKMN